MSIDVPPGQRIRRRHVKNQRPPAGFPEPVAIPESISLKTLPDAPEWPHRTLRPRHSPAEARPLAPAGNRSRAYLIAKRTLDVIGALLLILLLSPILLLTFLVLMVTTRGHPLFRQERVGYLGRPFSLHKFRTMVLDAERVRHLVSNEKDGPIFKNRADPRITRIGRVLRSFSIDEMPQLFNVLWGDMSLVGPRPPIAAEVADYEPWQRQRLAVKPGLTCLWQVSGRSEIGFKQWMLMDLWYVEHQSLATDLSLLWRTPQAVLSRRGAY